MCGCTMGAGVNQSPLDRADWLRIAEGHFAGAYPYNGGEAGSWLALFFAYEHD